MKTWLTRMIVLLIVAVLLVAAACAAPAPTPPPTPTPPTPAPPTPPVPPTPPEKVTIEFYCSAPAKTGGETVMLAIHDTLNELHPTFRAKWQYIPLPDSLAAIDQLDPDKRKYAFPVPFPQLDLLLAREGVGPAQHKYDKAYTDFMFAATIRHSGWTYFTLDPELAADPSKLAGKKVGSMDAPDADSIGCPEMLSYALLRDAWGILDQVEMVGPIAIFEVPVAFAEGKADAIFWGMANLCGGKWSTSGPFYGMLKEQQVYWLPVTQEDIDKINAANVFQIETITVPKGAVTIPGPPPPFPNPPEDVVMPRYTNVFMVWQDTPDDVVYELCKFLVDNEDAILQKGATLDLNPESMSTLPPGVTKDMVHPGALRYYQEQGVEVGE